MPRYVSLVNFTDQGLRNVGDTVNRAEQAKAAMAAKGAKIVDIYWTIGQYDLVLIAEAPDDETATRAMLSVARAGNVRTTTMRAFDADGMRRVLEGL